MITHTVIVKMPYSAAAGTSFGTGTPPHGRTKHNQFYSMDNYIRFTKMMVVVKKFGGRGVF